MINCYVVGEPRATESLCNFIREYPLTELKGHLFAAPNDHSDIAVVRPAIVFVDVEVLQGDDEWLEQLKAHCSIVLLSSSTTRVFEALDNAAFDYLVTPVRFDRFLTAVNKFDRILRQALVVHGQQKATEMDSFYIKADFNGIKEIKIVCAQLLYIQAMQNYVLIHMENGQRYSCHSSMKDMEEHLMGSSFSRIHKSYIINDNKITSIEGNMVVLNNNEKDKLLVGSTYRKSFFDKKNQKLIKKRNAGQGFPDSRIASGLIAFSMLWNECIEVMANAIF